MASEKKLSGASARRKGIDFERSVARDLRKILVGLEVRRGLQYQDGAAAPDIVCGGVLTPECKRRKKCDPLGALLQAERDAVPGSMPVAICKDDHKPATVTMRLEILAELLDAEADLEGPVVTMLYSDFLLVLQRWWAGR